MKKQLSTLGLAFTTLLTMNACANPEESGASAAGVTPQVESRTYETDPEIAAMLPDKYKDRGTFTVAVSPDIPPVKYVDDAGTITGFAPELLRAAGQVMGLEAEMEKGTFDSMVPGLESKKFDVIGSISDFEERRGKIDFIDYMYAGTGILTSTSFEMDQANPEDLCGHSIGFIVGTQQQGLLEAASEKCASTGEKPITGTGYPDGGASVLAVKSGQEDGAWIDAPVALYNVDQEPDSFKTVYLDKDSMLYGMGVNKENAEFRDALRAAMQKLATDGRYDELITGFGLKELELPEIPLNQGGSVKG
jgi:polar amino acid transport system substrate-binding protein